MFVMLIVLEIKLLSDILLFPLPDQEKHVINWNNLIQLNYMKPEDSALNLNGFAICICDLFIRREAN